MIYKFICSAIDSMACTMLSEIQDFKTINGLTPEQIAKLQAVVDKLVDIRNLIIKDAR